MIKATPYQIVFDISHSAEPGSELIVADEDEVAESVDEERNEPAIVSATMLTPEHLQRNTTGF